MKTPSLAGLTEHVKRGGLPCRVCACPHRKFIVEAAATEISLAAIARYITAEFEYELSAEAVTKHFRNQHEEKAKPSRTR